MSSGTGKKQATSKSEAKMSSTLYSTGITVATLTKFYISLKRDNTKNLFPFKPKPCLSSSQGVMSLE